MWPMKISSSKITPPQMKNVARNLTAIANFHVVADFASVEIGEVVNADVLPNFTSEAIR
jgi:hypothetical protein